MSGAVPDAVVHEPERGRFVLVSDGTTAVLEYRRLADRKLDFHHTFVPDALRGRGIASRLAEHALQYALDNGFTVVPTCPFVASYIERQPRFKTVLGGPAR